MSSNKDKRPCVLVVGDWMRDVWVTIKPRQMSAEAGILVYDEIASRTYEGGAGNVVNNLNNLGGVDVVYPVPPEPEAGPMKIRFVDETGRQLFRVDQHDWVEEVDVDDIHDIAGMWNPQTIVISDYRKGAVTSNVIDTLATVFPDAIYLIDTKRSPRFYTKLKNKYFFPNLTEFGNFTLEYSGAEIDRTIIKRGKEGSSGPRIGPGEYINHTLISPVENPRSVCGAGDVFLACFAQQFALGNDMVSCIRSANEKTAEVIRFGYDTLGYGNVFGGKLGN
jgi:bifunctional ADP-heptose synthase (sugar kinase/adenylyltransferase)